MPDAKAPPKANPKASSQGLLNPYRNYSYQIVADSIIGHFTRLEGLGMRIHPIRYREGGRNEEVIQLMGPVEYPEAKLSYGILASDQATVWSWLNNIQREGRDRRQVLIQHKGADDNDTITYVLNEAWICEWHGAALDSLGREFAVESISLVYQSITRQ